MKTMMNRKMVAGIALLATMTFMTSCMREWRSFSASDEQRVTEVRSLKGFEEIEINGSPTVYYEQADSFSVLVKGPSSGVEDIQTDTRQKTLAIRNRGKIGILDITINGGETAVYVTSPDLVAVRLNGSGDFVSQKRVDTDNMKIVLRGSGDIRFKDLICDHCSSELVGSGDLNVDMLDAQTSTVSLVGSGDIRLQQRNVRETEVTLKGSGDVSVNFAEGCRSARCQLRGSGDITLSGRLGQYKGQKSGSGDIDTDKLSVEK